MGGEKAAFSVFFCEKNQDVATLLIKCTVTKSGSEGNLFDSAGETLYVGRGLVDGKLCLGDWNALGQSYVQFFSPSSYISYQ